MRFLLLVGLGGAAGSMARYLTVEAAARLIGTAFPWGTFAVNIFGSFAIGVAIAAIAGWFGGSPELRLLLVTGFLGGFTTFSAFSFDMLGLIERQAFLSLATYAVGTVLLSLAATAIGFAGTKALLS